VGVKNLATRLAELRESKGLSQEQLSVASGVTFSTIQNIEYGRSVDPGVFNIDKLADALGVSIQDLIGKENLEKNKDSIIVEIISGLPALNQDQLNAILSNVTNYLSSSSDTLKRNRG